MKKIALRIAKLYIGLFVCAVGIVMAINASLGLAPWDAFNQGLGILFGITIGRASILVGLILVTINYFVGEKLGWGTMVNIIFVGLFIDFLMLNHLIPIFDSFIPSLIMMLLGAFVEGFGGYLYLDAGLGAGPRDGLIVFLVKGTEKPIRVVKTSMEIIVVVIGYALGASIGIGTVVMATSAGSLMQLAFKVANFDVESVEHRYIEDDIRWIKERLKSKIRSGKDIYIEEKK